MKRILSIFLSAVLMASMLVVPAGAATTYTVSVTHNGEVVYHEAYPANYAIQNQAIDDLELGVDATVTVSNGSGHTERASGRPISMSGTLPGGTTYSLSENSSRIVSLTAAALKEDISIAIDTTAHSYTVTANSGPLGFKNDLGSTSDPTCFVSMETQTVRGNQPWTVTFTPDDGLYIKSLNIRENYSGRVLKDAASGSVTVGDTVMKITVADSGAVTVSTDHAAGNMVVTALTSEKPDEYRLSMYLDGHVSSDVSSCFMTEGATKTITLTADDGYLVEDITITDGSSTAVLTPTMGTVSVNGHTYSVTRGLDRKVVLTVPAVKADVAINVETSAYKAYLYVDAGLYASSNYPDVSFLDQGGRYTVNLDPDYDMVIESVKVESATDSAYLYGEEDGFWLDGNWYEVYFYDDTSLTIYFEYLPGSLRITANGEDAYHTITLEADGGSDYNGSRSRITVADGDDETVGFTPNYGYTIERLVFNYNGSTYYADEYDSYITINGTRCPIEWYSDGEVEVTLKNISFDIKVSSDTDYDGDYAITLKTDGGVEVSGGASKVYADRGEDETITFVPESGYTIEEIDITRNGTTYAVDRGETYISINGTRHTISWRSNGNVVVTLYNITANMTVSAVSDYDGAYGDYTITMVTDGGAESSDGNSRAYVYSGRSRTLTFEPVNGYSIKKVAITRGNGTAYTVERGTTYVTINGTRHNIAWNNNGNVSVTLNNVTADMRVQVTTNYDGGTGDYWVDLTTDGGAEVSTGLSRVYVDKNDDETITFVPVDNYSIQKLVITRGSGNPYTVNKNTTSVTIGGTKHTISWKSNGNVVLTLNNITDDMEVSVVTNYDGRSGDYAITLQNDGGAEALDSAARVYVDRGDSHTITFAPIDNNTIETVKITRSGTTYTADRDDDYITISGVRHTLSWKSNGNVVITLKNISSNMTVAVETDVADGQYYVTRLPDGNSRILLSTPSDYVDVGDPVTVSVSPLAGYQLSTVSFKFGDTTIPIYTGTSSFIYNGKTYTVNHYADGSITVNFGELPGNLTVTSTGVLKGTTVQPSTPTQTHVYHEAYINGVGNGLFAPLRSTTRAEALVMLVRTYCGAGAYTVTGSAPLYPDVPSSAWYAGYVSFAYNNGYLQGLHNIANGFRPTDIITRAEFTEMVCRFAGLNTAGNYGYAFYDVTSAHWANTYITTAANNGWVVGYGNGYFGPDASMTRAEMVTIINRVMGRVPDRVSINNSGWLTTFHDVDPSYWAYYDIIEASNSHYCSVTNSVETWYTN